MGAEEKPVVIGEIADKELAHPYRLYESQVEAATRVLQPIYDDILAYKSVLAAGLLGLGGKIKAAGMEEIIDRPVLIEQIEGKLDLRDLQAFVVFEDSVNYKFFYSDRSFGYQDFKQKGDAFHFHEATLKPDDNGSRILMSIEVEDSQANGYFAITFEPLQHKVGFLNTGVASLGWSLYIKPQRRDSTVHSKSAG
jgi:hypothetical protein